MNIAGSGQFIQEYCRKWAIFTCESCWKWAIYVNIAGTGLKRKYCWNRANIREYFWNRVIYVNISGSEQYIYVNIAGSWQHT